MKKIYILLTAVFIFIFYAATSAQPVTITLQPDGLSGKDAMIANCIPCGYDISNYGNSSEWNAVAWTNGGAISNSRALIQFDLTSIPVGSVVQSATLSLYFNPVSSNIGHSQLSGANDAYLLKITSPWEETIVTWNNQPGTSLTNQVYFPPSISSTQDYLNMNVTAMIQDFVNAPGQNYGMMLKLNTEQHYRSLIFASSDHADPTKHPKLDICYMVPPTITPAGATTFCTGGSVVLNANTGAGLSYQWKKNGTNISGATGSSFTATTSGSYTVTETNSCGSVTSAPVVVIMISVPAVPGTISGPSSFCAYQIGVAYSITPVANATTYNWTVPQGATVTSGQGTTSITVNYGTKKGTIKVRAGNVCGNSAYRSLTVNKTCREGFISIENEFEVTVFPNPSSGDFVFEIENANEEKISINVFDVIGKLVLSETDKGSHFTIQNTQLTPGIYSAVIIVGGNKKTLKIVKTE